MRLATSASLAMLLAVAFAPPAGSSAQGAESRLVQHRIEVVGPSGAREPVMITLPRLAASASHPPGHRWPVLVALHGLGEAQRGPGRGYLGWNVDYAMPRAYEALLRGRLDASDYGGFVRPEHLARVNAWLAARSFEGVAVVTPYTPAIALPEQGAARARYGRWVVGTLLPSVRRAVAGLSSAPEGTGIDGVSLGGRIALEVGFRHPEAFGAVGGIQPAVRGDADRLAEMVRVDAHQRIRLLTSDGDGFQEATRLLGRSLERRGIDHELLVLPGPHAYAFNRGPGSIELLRFGATALRGDPASD